MTKGCPVQEWQFGDGGGGVVKKNHELLLECESVRGSYV